VVQRAELGSFATAQDDTSIKSEGKNNSKSKDKDKPEVLRLRLIS